MMRDFDEIKDAVRAGSTVHWKNPLYVVVCGILPDGTDDWCVSCPSTDNVAGMHPSQYDPGDFYVA